MINFDDYTNENNTQHNTKWPYIPDHPNRILIKGGWEFGKTNVLLNLINNQPDIDKMYLYAKNPYAAKYQLLINKKESIGLKHFNDPKVFIKYSNDMQDVYKNIDECNIDKERKIFPSFLLHNHTLKVQEMLYWILLTFLLLKSQIKDNFNKLHWIIHLT